MPQTAKLPPIDYTTFTVFQSSYAASGHDFVIAAADEQARARKLGEYALHLISGIKRGNLDVYGDDVFAYVANVARLAYRCAQITERLRDLATTAPRNPVTWCR